MRIEYPIELAISALEDQVLLVFAEPWLRDIVVRGVASLAAKSASMIPTRPPWLEPEEPIKRPTEVVETPSLAELAALTAPGGPREVDKARTVIFTDGDRDAEPLGELVTQRALEGWRILVAGRRPDLEKRLAGRTHVRVWPAANIQEIAFQISQLRV
jgi:hypothetical protein